MEHLDPLQFAATLWPDVKFDDWQKDVIRSVRDNRQTFVVAANKVGKDFVAGFIVPWFFLTRMPCRILTTSATEKHLNVLWGEMRRFLMTASEALGDDAGGPLRILENSITRTRPDGDVISLIEKHVAAPGKTESLAGYHAVSLDDPTIPCNLFVADEASAVPDEYYVHAKGWAQRMLIFGNAWGQQGFFRRAFEGTPGADDSGGDILNEYGSGYYRKTFRVRAADSCNAKRGLDHEARGEEPDNELLIPGILTFQDYKERRRYWDAEQQCVGLDAAWYSGEDVMLFPAEWLDMAAKRAEALQGAYRVAKTIGVDPAEGSDKTVWVVADDLGVIDLIGRKTPDTSVIPDETLRLMQQYGVTARNVLFDAGGGGKQHADWLRRRGHQVRGVVFGASATPEKYRGRARLSERKAYDETRRVYRNRRNQMYGILSEQLNPAFGEVFAIPARFCELRRQLGLIPRRHDQEGRLDLPPKQKREGARRGTSTLTEIIGHSPDEADALALAVFGLAPKHAPRVLGAFV